MKANSSNPYFVPTNISRAPRPRTDRPAKQQITEMPKPTEEAASGEYNIWYHKHMGFDQKKPKALTRIDPSEDTGMTTCPLESNICLNFARGCCMKGYKCTFKHQLPTEDDELRVAMLRDVFGRQRHATDKEDMDGVGNFNRNNRTLYLGGVVCKDDARVVEKEMKKDFGQFGELEYVRCIASKAIGFVRFKLRVAAEFAREAMQGQQTSYGEIQVKWAHLDPNPLAKEFDRRADEALAQYAAAKKLLQMSDREKKEWKQQQLLQQGIYPDTDDTQKEAILEPQHVEEANVQQQQQQQQQPWIDPSRAQMFAVYWAEFFAKKMAEEFNLPLDSVLPPELKQLQEEEERKKREEEIRQQKLLVNPHTGEKVEDEFALNPFSQAPHPYAYRDYGWNRPKSQKKDGDKERKKQKRAVQEALEEQTQKNARDDVNFSYGPSGASSAKREKRSSQHHQGQDSIQVGQASYAPQQQAQVTFKMARGRVAQATQEEIDALNNDEPLVFKK